MCVGGGSYQLIKFGFILLRDCQHQVLVGHEGAYRLIQEQVLKLTFSHVHLCLAVHVTEGLRTMALHGNVW